MDGEKMDILSANEKSEDADSTMTMTLACVPHTVTDKWQSRTLLGTRNPHFICSPDSRHYFLECIRFSSSVLLC